MSWLQRFIPLNHTEHVPRYLASSHVAKWAPSYRKDTQRFLVQWTPELGRNPSRKEIICLLDKVQVQKGERTADRVKIALSGYFNFLTDEELTFGNPMRGLKNRDRNDGRERFLSLPEIKVLWEATEPAPHNPVPADFCRIVRLLLLTGQRRNEIGRLAWNELDRAGPQVSLPRERCKNRRAHDFPLSDLALEQLPPQREGFPFVFGHRRDRGFSGWSKSKQILDTQIVGIPHWTLHDLRRTVGTHLARLGVRQEVTEALQNHKSGKVSGVAAIYNRHSYAHEKREALDAWATEVQRTVGAS